MNETQTIGAYTSKTGKVYSYDIERQTRTDFATMGDPSTRYDRVYYQVNVYVDGKRLNFAFIDDVNDSVAIHKAVLSVVEWDETPSHVLKSMHSRYD